MRNLSIVLFLIHASFLLARENSLVSERMIGGVEVPIQQIPFQGSVEAIGTHQCSGAIVSSKYALITGVCAESFRVAPEIATLRFGTVTRLYDGKAHRCSAVTQHPKFDQFNNTFEQKDYDIAVAEIFPELQIDNVTIKPISLPTAAPAVGTLAQLSGWGSIEQGGAIMVYARARNVSITDQTACRTAYQDVFPVSDRMLCAGNPNGVTCDGDHASLLVVNNTLVGMSSWGYGCGQTGLPDVYVNIANAEIRAFIRNVTGI